MTATVQLSGAMLIGAEAVTGALVAHSLIKAVGFTGSRSGGRALVEKARRLPEPIPVYAEMSSINPVYLFPSRLGRTRPARRCSRVDVSRLAAQPELRTEMFGAASLLVRYGGVEDLLAATRLLEGQLTATAHAHATEYAGVARLLPLLERKVGRILFGGWPTGVDVNHTMVHGGPFPATSDSRTTSVGTLAVERFLRRVASPDVPDELLPAPLQDANPWHGTIEGR